MNKINSNVSADLTASHTAIRAGLPHPSRPKVLTILGTRGIPARHGGFETFAEQLSLFLVERGWQVTVYCQVDDPSDTADTTWRGVRLVRISVPDTGALGTIHFDWLATARAAREGGLVLTLGYNNAIFLALLKLRGVPNLINMDGVEWRRAKWSKPAKLWLYLNERVAPMLANHLIADNPHIKAHLERHTDGRHITMIPYGSDVVEHADPSLLVPLDLAPRSYALVVARAEPENSIIEILRAFVAQPRGIKLVIVGTYSPSIPYHAEVLAIAGQHRDQVLMPGAIYDTEVLRALRLYARIYVHGHQVGGTNPSLVEALGAGNACVIRDNPFNRWVAGNAGRYFRDMQECESVFDDLLDDEKALAELRTAARQRHGSTFGVSQVLEQYETLLAAWGDQRAAATAPVSLDSVPIANAAALFSGPALALAGSPAHGGSVTIIPATRPGRLNPKLRRALLPLTDLVLAPVAAASAHVLRLSRTLTLAALPRTERAIAKVGIYPLIDHYYEPLFDLGRLKRPLGEPRTLPGLELDVDAGIALLSSLPETRALGPLVQSGGVPGGYQLDNDSFPAGDAEVLFGLLRHHKPARVIEVGCGNSTLVMRAALALNAASGAPAEHICIEPFEQPWLEGLGVKVIRDRVEVCDPAMFDELRAGDVLFVDSSHMIRPQGDVLHQVLTIFGRLRAGVLVHIHDIFTPRDYPDDLLRRYRLFWNEQYLVEAFLAFNDRFRVLLPLNHLWHERREAVHAACPCLSMMPHRRPASMWLVRK